MHGSECLAREREREREERERERERERENGMVGAGPTIRLERVSRETICLVSSFNINTA